MLPCNEDVSLCAPLNDGKVNATTTIYTGSCQGLVTNHPDRWCYYTSIESNICCGNTTEDCCVVASGKVFITTLGSSVLISGFVFLLPLLLIGAWKYLQSSHANFKEFRSKVAPPGITTAPPPRSNYVPKSTMALAIMKQEPVVANAPEVSRRWVQSLPHPPNKDGRPHIPAHGTTIYDENDPLPPKPSAQKVTFMEPTAVDPNAATNASKEEEEEIHSNETTDAFKEDEENI